MTKHSGLSVWDLPNLLGSVHRYRKSAPNVRTERPHFRAILAFVHRNRFAISSQIQRRFELQLRSDRTARRHLAEMEALGLLGVVGTMNVGPLWPKVYFVTRRGLTRLREALHEQGQDWSESTKDRRRSDGTSAQHVLHELFVTEFLLMAWEATQKLADIQILTMQRRSLAKHTAFTLVIGARRTRLEPDAMFLYRREGKGMMCCFVELDLDSMTPRQMAVKFRRYQGWAESPMATSYLKCLYEQHGAKAPAPTFRILVVIGSRNRQAERRRMGSLLNVIKGFPPAFANRIWLTSVHQLQELATPGTLMGELLWLRPRDINNTRSSIGTGAVAKLPRNAMLKD